MKAVEPSASSAMVKKAPQSRNSAGRRAGSASPTSAGQQQRRRHREEGKRHGAARAEALPGPAPEDGREQQRIAGRNQQPAGQLALAGDHHQHRPVDEERRPEAGAAEGDQPGEPQPRLRDEAADIGERIGRPRLARPDRSGCRRAGSTRTAPAGMSAEQRRPRHARHRCRNACRGRRRASARRSRRASTRPCAATSACMNSVLRMWSMM